MKGPECLSFRLGPVYMEEFYLAADRLHEKTQRYLGRQVNPGWRVTWFKGKVTMGAGEGGGETTFYHINLGSPRAYTRQLTARRV